MKIEHITIRRVCNPIKRPYVTAFGSQSAFNSVLVSLESDGCTGWGESAPGGGPFFGPEYDVTAFAVCRDFIAPRLLKQALKSPADLQVLLAPIRGNGFAKAAFDVAFWDLSSYINIKYARVGGITTALKIHDLCGEKGVGCWLGGMGESSLGTTVVANLATLPNVNYPSDISPAEKFYVRNLGTPVLTTDVPGTYTVRDKPGLDVIPEPGALRDFTVEEVALHA